MQRQLADVLNHLTVARVTMVKVEDKHRLPQPTTDDRSRPLYSHFFGYAKLMDGSDRSVWFKKANQVSEFHVGPVSFQAQTTLQPPPEKGMFIVGNMRSSPKGPVFHRYAVEGAAQVHAMKGILKKGPRTMGKRHYMALHRAHAPTADAAFALLLCAVTESPQFLFDCHHNRIKHFVKRLSPHEFAPFSMADPIAFAFYTAMLLRSREFWESVVKISEQETLHTVWPRKYSASALQYYLAQT